MNTNQTRDERSKARALRMWPAALLAVGLAAGLGGCNDLLQVKLPGDVTAESLDNPALADILVNSVIADFECAYDNYNFGTSVLSDEMMHSTGNLVERNWGQRKITATDNNYVNGSCGGWGYGLWSNMHKARFESEDVADRITNWGDEVSDQNKKLATVRTYGAFLYAYFGETFCQANFDGGPAMDPPAVLAIAEEKFQSALELAQASGDATLLNAARVGLARVRLDLGDYAGAKQLAELVPEGFVFNATRGEDFNYRYNKGRTQFFEIGNHTVAPGFRSLEWKGVPDPRVKVIDQGRFGLDGVTELWTSDKWPSRSTPVPIATWKEARLIMAEAAAKTADNATAVAIINDFHTRAGLPTYDPATDGPVMEHVIQERSRELFQEGGHRLNDMLRFGLPFFSGDDPGGTYGNTTCWPFPAVEGG
ncbi:MAG: RagB/SusD family nutrient uptake outer membrane protein [Gemmatimonadetes bacterium]|nr:RagB/SusD family nutrient uptake outer membrane protein [Gemmatimonadota bacterium]